MKRRKRGHRIQIDGPGRIREQLAEMIRAQLDCKCDPAEIWMNNYPAARWLDLARWGVTCRLPDGMTYNVHSWDRMSDIVRFGLAIVCKEHFQIEVCSGQE